MYCVACGKKFEFEDQKYCRHCGAQRLGPSTDVPIDPILHQDHNSMDSWLLYHYNRLNSTLERSTKRPLAYFCLMLPVGDVPLLVEIGRSMRPGVVI